MTEDQALINVLAGLSDEAKPYFDHYAKLRPDFGARERAEWLATQPPPHQFDELRKSIQVALECHSVLGGERSCFFGSKQLMLHPRYQTYNLLSVSHARGPVEAVAWLHKVYGTTQADLRYVVEVHGLKVSSRITLSNGVQLMPLEQLPLSSHASSLIAQYQVRMFPSTLPMFPPIGATFEVHKVHASTDPEKSVASLGPRSTELERSVRAFALAGEASPIIGIGWIEFIDPDLTLAEVGRMWMSPMDETGVSNAVLLDVNEEALAWVERYIKLPSDVKRVCDVATERLALARRRRHAGNKAIEGAICLEALLGDRSNQELIYRLRLRAALLLAKDLEARRKISNAIRDFYDLRSKTVHGDPLSPDKAQQQQNCATQGIAICADALRAIVTLGKKYFPEEWELSGGMPAHPSG